MQCGCVLVFFSRRPSRESFVAVLLRLLYGATFPPEVPDPRSSPNSLATPARLGFIDKLKQKDNLTVRYMRLTSC